MKAPSTELIHWLDSEVTSALTLPVLECIRIRLARSYTPFLKRP